MVDMMQVIKPVIAIIRNGVTDNEVIPSRASASIFLLDILIHLQFFLHGYIAPRSRGIPQEALIHVNIYFTLYIV
ncbi:hypothetical protein HMPREF0484_0326 [Klebsiella pneumoniae subsp. rhinoscleromatis ATCC 13884]|nr:hypothetical protein HMPREF0484_0326 [Klebsiella pneumoniae subsp. rhinoscleromatis ATCC 13884]